MHAIEGTEAVSAALEEYARVAFDDGHSFAESMQMIRQVGARLEFRQARGESGCPACSGNKKIHVDPGGERLRFDTACREDRFSKSTGTFDQNRLVDTSDHRMPTVSVFRGFSVAARSVKRLDLARAAVR
jgi:hypothetical protein